VPNKKIGAGTSAFKVTVPDGYKGYVYFGSAKRGDGKELINGFHTVHLHPNYVSSGNQAGFDVAVVDLDRPYDLSDSINIAYLPTSNQNDYEGATAWATGYGTTNNGKTPDYLLKAQMKVLSRKACKGTYSSPNDDKLVCGKSNASICSGDSGGGLYFNDGGKWSVIGVASVKTVYSSDGCDPAVPSGYVRVSEHLDFINSNINSSRLLL
jgi:chymotrypsin C